MNGFDELGAIAFYKVLKSISLFDIMLVIPAPAEKAIASSGLEVVPQTPNSTPAWAESQWITVTDFSACLAAHCLCALAIRRSRCTHCA